MVRLSNANFINNYPQPVFHFNESQLRCVKVIVTQTLQRRPLAAHASKFRVSGNTPLSLRYSSLPANVFRGSSCVPARGTPDEPPKIVYGGGYRHGPIYIKAKTAGFNSLDPLFLFRLHHAENDFLYLSKFASRVERAWIALSTVFSTFDMDQ